MKIGLCSDVHGDLDGLYKALDLFEREHCDHVLCAGDLVDKGPHGDTVVRAIRGRGIPTVRGNHDKHAERSQAIAREFPDLPIEPVSDETVL